MSASRKRRQLMGWGKYPISLGIVIFMTALICPFSSAESSYTSRLINQAEEVFFSEDVDSQRGEIEQPSTSNNLTFALNQIKSKLESIEPTSLDRLSDLLERPVELEKTFATDHFRLHYDLSGENAITHNEDLTFISDAGEICEACWSIYHTDQLWPEPLCDNGAGSDSLIDVYFINLGPNIFGYAMHEDIPGESGKTGFIVLNSDYRDNIHLAAGEALRTTIAHEYHHLIQFGFGYRPEANWFMEQLAMMEESVVFPEINDAQRYLPIYTHHPYRSLNLSNGSFEYGTWLWPLYLIENFGWPFIISVWERWAENDTLTMIDAFEETFDSSGSTLSDSILEWSVWNAFLGHRDDGAHYSQGSEITSLIQPEMTVTSYPSFDRHPGITRQIQDLAASYIEFTNQDNSADNTLTVSVSAGDNLENGHFIAWDHSGTLVENSDLDIKRGSISLTVYGWDKIETLWLVLTTGRSSTTTTDYRVEATTSYISDASVDIEHYNQNPLKLNNVPNPFQPYTKIFFSVETETHASLRIFDVEGRMIHQLVDAITTPGEHAVLWDGNDANGQQVSAGIFFCLLQTPDNQSRIRMIRMQ